MLVAVRALAFLLDIDDTFYELFDFPTGAVSFRQKQICWKIVVWQVKGVRRSKRVTEKSPLVSLFPVCLSACPFFPVSLPVVLCLLSPWFVSPLSLFAWREINYGDKKQRQTRQRETGRRDMRGLLTVTLLLLFTPSTSPQLFCSKFAFSKAKWIWGKVEYLLIYIADTPQSTVALKLNDAFLDTTTTQRLWLVKEREKKFIAQPATFNPVKQHELTSHSMSCQSNFRAPKSKFSLVKIF